MKKRDEFFLSCLNAAVNLYGIVTAKEFCEVYNGYARNHEVPISTPLAVEEAVDAARHLLQNIAEKEDDEILDIMVEDAWYSLLRDDRTGEWLFVYESFTNEVTDGDEDVAVQTCVMRNVMQTIAETRATFSDVPLKIPPEDVFLMYDDPYGEEETTACGRLEKFLKKEYRLTKTQAEYDVMDIQANLRMGGASLSYALQYISEQFDYGPKDEAGLRRLMDALSPVVGATRTWQYRGHTQHEMYELGKIDKYTREDIPDYFGVFDGNFYGDDDYDDEEDYDDGYDEEKGEPVRVEELPPAEYTGPVDFGFVKDARKREKALFAYEGVRIVTRDFIRRIVMRELTKEERRDAAKRLGFSVNSRTGYVDDGNLDCVAGDFAAMMDDQHGEPAIKRVLKRRDGLDDELDRAAAAYYENYRYTWLEVLAAKAGVGVKCRDLMTGEDLFLMEKSLSMGDVKGMTICAGIAPMGEVYLALGTIHPARFESPAIVLKIVLTHLGLPAEPPICLSFADQARFAAETIRRINANGRFSSIVY